MPQSPGKPVLGAILGAVLGVIAVAILQQGGHPASDAPRRLRRTRTCRKRRLAGVDHRLPQPRRARGAVRRRALPRLRPDGNPRHVRLGRNRRGLRGVGAGGRNGARDSRGHLGSCAHRRSTRTTPWRGRPPRRRRSATGTTRSASTSRDSRSRSWSDAEPVGADRPVVGGYRGPQRSAGRTRGRVRAEAHRGLPRVGIDPGRRGSVRRRAVPRYHSQTTCSTARSWWACGRRRRSGCSCSASTSLRYAGNARNASAATPRRPRCPRFRRAGRAAGTC